VQKCEIKADKKRPTFQATKSSESKRSPNLNKQIKAAEACHNPTFNTAVAYESLA
jgi:hypothetical protein